MCVCNVMKCFVKRVVGTNQVIKYVGKCLKKWTNQGIKYVVKCFKNGLTKL